MDTMDILRALSNEARSSDFKGRVLPEEGESDE
jgi:hypothetical protein